jgi:hypothetical protein
LAVVSGSLALLVAFCTLAFPKVKLLWVILGIAGILVIASSAWAIYDIKNPAPFIEMLGTSIDYGFGLYLTIAGGIYIGVAGALGFKFER